MSARDLARAIAAGRLAVGAGLLLAPRLGARAWLGDDSAAAVVLIYALGVRDAAIGAGGVGALRARRAARPWILAGALADAVDAAATRGAASRLPRRAQVVVALGAAGALAGVAAATSVD